MLKLIRKSSVVASMVVLTACTNGQLVSYGNNSNSNGNQPPTAFNELGQPDFNSLLANNGGVTSSSLANPGGIATDGTRLFVADTGNNRVLIWNNIPSALNQPADVVLGQPTMTSNTSNYGTISANSLSGPTGVFATSSQLYVADTNNHRVLGYAFPYSNFMAATLELGQSNFTLNTAYAVQASALSYPRAIHFDGTYMYITDPNWNRVSAFFLSGIANNQTPNFVLGQINSTSSLNGNGATSLSSPSGVFFLNSQVFVSDSANNRILGYNIDATVGEAASTVIGQSSFGISMAGTSATALSQPQGIFGDSSHLFVADSFNNRIIEYNQGYYSGMSASYVYGQGNLSNGGTGFTSNQSLNTPSTGCELNGAVYVVDTGNNRIMVFSER